MSFDTFRFSHLRSWDEITQAGIELAMNVMVHHFAIGDLAMYACPTRSAGRPAEADKPKTLTALAKAIGLDRSTVSNAAANSEFWRGAARTKLPLQATLGLLSKARKATGWKPGEKPTPDQLAMAEGIILGEIEAPKPTKELNVLGILRSIKAKIELLFSDQHRAELLAALEPSDLGLLEMAAGNLSMIDTDDTDESNTSSS